jgi:pilus assembly protein Flp/PilA
MKKFLKDESGATAIEYGLIASAIGLMLIVAAPILATAISQLFGRLGEGMASA